MILMIWIVITIISIPLLFISSVLLQKVDEEEMLDRASRYWEMAEKWPQYATKIMEAYENEEGYGD